MAIYKHSRYATGLNIYYDNKKDETFIDFPRTSLDISKEDGIYQIRAGETLDFLAQQFYGDSQLKWLILYANPSYQTEFDIQVGDSLVIPSMGRIDDIVNGVK